MINIKKGNGMSLAQSDVRGNTVAGVTAGMVCYKDPDGDINVGYVPSTDTGIPGFAINSSTDGDVIESGKIALYTFDGGGVIETDQAAVTINTTNFPIGTPVYAYAAGGGNAGKVANYSVSSGSICIGWVEGIRNMQLDSNYTYTTQNYTSLDSEGNSSTKAYIYSGQKNSVPMLGIKLASTAAARTA